MRLSSSVSGVWSSSPWLTWYPYQDRPQGSFSTACYIVPAGATGAWAGKADQIAVRINGAWEYHAPKVGWLAFIAAEDRLAVYKTGGWSAGVSV